MDTITSSINRCSHQEPGTEDILINTIPVNSCAANRNNADTLKRSSRKPIMANGIEITGDNEI